MVSIIRRFNRIQSRVNIMVNKDLVHQAGSYYREEFLCSQSVLMAYAPQLGIELKDAAKIAAPFGAGMSRMGWTCGAVTGALMVIGMHYGHEVGSDIETKELMYKKVREFLSEFEGRNGSVVCSKLLGRNIRRPNELEAAREDGLFESICTGFVSDAVEIVEKVITRE